VTTTRRVHVRFTKWDGSLHWHFDMTRLGEDEHGVWLGAPQNTPVQRAAEPPIMSPAFALLVVENVYWTATFNTPAWQGPFAYDVYVDVCTPPRWLDGEVTAIDLDLDVARGFEGRVEIRDEDEFEQHRIRFGYPDEIVAEARAAAVAARRALEAGAEPFATVGDRWLEQAVRL
jgi:uncharacterized protein